MYSPRPSPQDQIPGNGILLPLTNGVGAHSPKSVPQELRISVIVQIGQFGDTTSPQLVGFFDLIGVTDASQQEALQHVGVGEPHATVVHGFEDLECHVLVRGADLGQDDPQEPITEVSECRILEIVGE